MARKPAKKISKTNLDFMVDMDGRFFRLSKAIVKHIATNYFKSAELEGPDEVDPDDTEYIITNIDFEYEMVELTITYPFDFEISLPFSAIYNNTWPTTIDFWAERHNDQSTTTIVTDRLGKSEITIEGDLRKYWNIRKEIEDVVYTDVIDYLWSKDSYLDLAGEILGVDEPEVSQTYFVTSNISGKHMLVIDFVGTEESMYIPFEDIETGHVRKFVREWLKNA